MELAGNKKVEACPASNQTEIWNRDQESATQEAFLRKQVMKIQIVLPTLVESRARTALLLDILLHHLPRPQPHLA